MVVESAKPKRSGKQPIQFQDSEAASANLAAKRTPDEPVERHPSEPVPERSAEKRKKRTKKSSGHRSEHPTFGWIRHERWFLILLLAVIGIGIGAIIIAGR